jgi:hypothetical protein
MASARSAEREYLTCKFSRERMSNWIHGPSANASLIGDLKTFFRACGCVVKLLRTDDGYIPYG